MLLTLAAILFGLGLAGLLVRRNLLFILMTWMYWDSPEETKAAEDEPNPLR